MYVLKNKNNKNNEEEWTIKNKWRIKVVRVMNRECNSEAN